MVEPAPVDGSDPIENYEVVRSELDQYDPTLRDRVEIVVLTKAELPGSEAVRERLALRLAADDRQSNPDGTGHVDSADAATAQDRVLAVSAVTGQGLDRLLRAITRALDQRAAANSAPVGDLSGKT